MTLKAAMGDAGVKLPGGREEEADEMQDGDCTVSWTSVRCLVAGGVTSQVGRHQNQFQMEDTGTPESL